MLIIYVDFVAKLKEMLNSIYFTSFYKGTKDPNAMDINAIQVAIQTLEV